jgi:hypothetical protein
VLRHQALAAIKVGLHVRVNLQPMCVVNVAADLAPERQGSRQQACSKLIVMQAAVVGAVHRPTVPVCYCSVLCCSCRLRNCGSGALYTVSFCPAARSAVIMTTYMPRCMLAGVLQLYCT